jgi:hypothetical protein
MKNDVFWDAKPSALIRTDVSEEYIVFLRSMLRLLFLFSHKFGIFLWVI